MFKNITNQVVDEITKNLIEVFTPVLKEEIAKMMVNVQPLIEAEISSIGQQVIAQIPALEKVIEAQVPILINGLTPIIEKEVDAVGQEIIAQIKSMQKS